MKESVSHADRLAPTPRGHGCLPATMAAPADPGTNPPAADVPVVDLAAPLHAAAAAMADACAGVGCFFGGWWRSLAVYVGVGEE